MLGRWIVAAACCLTTSRALAIGGPAIVPATPAPAPLKIVPIPPASAPPSIFEPAELEPDIRARVGGAKGSLDKEIIRRVIRSNIADVTLCYENELAARPQLAGNVMIQFTISATGQVIASVLQRSTMANESVETCVVRALRHWTFPKPLGGGVVIVSYPFVLRPAKATVLAVRAGGVGGVGGVEILPIDGRLLMHRSTDAAGIPANGLIAVGDKGLLLVDTGWNDAQTDAILDWGRAHLGREWAGAVITHDHADRDGGIGALLRRGIRVAALDLTVAKLAARGVRSIDTLLTATAASVNDTRGFEAFYPGRGHAPDNIVVAFPWSNVVFGGCLVKEQQASELGFTGDADFASWPVALRRVGERYPQMLIVPGHGAFEPKVTIQHTLDLLGERIKRANASLPK